MKKTFLAVAAAAILLPPLAKAEPAAITKDDLITRLRQLEFPLRTNTEHYDL